jgi:hypothetical protein
MQLNLERVSKVYRGGVQALSEFQLSRSLAFLDAWPERRGKIHVDADWLRLRDYKWPRLVERHRHGERSDSLRKVLGYSRKILACIRI